MDPQPTIVLQAAPSTALVSGLGPAMQLLNDMVNEIARTDIPVLIVGESGTGKDTYARQIHRLSLRNEMRLHKFNCASYDSGLLSPHRRQPRDGASWENPCGTLYLDNIQELDSAAQRGLLSFLSEGEDTEAGIGQRARFVSSSTSSLEPEVEMGRFRRELYFRLNGACLRIPPLRERIGDIPVLAEHFLAKHSSTLNKNAPHLSEKAARALCDYHWPGNIRELENVTRKAVLFGDFQIALNELQSAVPAPSNLVLVAQGSSLKMAARAASKKAERELILQALERTHWNRKRAARDLQISYKSLLYKIKQIGVSERKLED